MSTSRTLLAACCIAASAACSLEDLTGGATTINGGVGATCRSVANCRPGLQCSAGACAATGDRNEGGTCLISDECGPGLYCSLVLKCEKAGSAKDGEACQSPAGCEKGLYCQLKGLNGVCAKSGTKDLDAACTATSDCLGGLYCIGGTCSSAVQLPDKAPKESCAATGALDAPLRAYFQVPRGGAKLPDFYRLPYPNNIRLKNGHVSLEGHPSPGDSLVGIDIVKEYMDLSAEDLTGFGTSSAVYFRFSGPIKFDTVTASGTNASLFWVDLTTSERRGLQYLWDPNRGRYICHNKLAVRPPDGDPLLGGHAYAVVLTTMVKDATGTALAQDADFTAVIGDAAPTDPDLLAAHTAYAPLRAYLAAQSISKDTVAVATVFTTQDPGMPMSKLRPAAHAAAAPTPKQATLCASGVTSPCADTGAGADPSRSCGAVSSAFHEIHFKASLPVFQHGTPPYESPEDGGDIRVDASGVPTLARMEDICFALTIPKNATMPAGGWPVVIYTHGTGGSFRSHAEDGTAESFSAASPGTGDPVHFAVLGYDQIQHGPRRGTSTRKPDHLVFNFLNPRGSRDGFLQGAADAFSAVRLARSLDLTVGAAGLIQSDDAHIFFMGHSQGATHGPMFLAYETDVKTAILSGAGALLIESLLGKHNPVDVAKAMQLAMVELQTVDAFHPILNIFQAYFERSDPINFGRLITLDPPTADAWKHIFQTYGLKDTFTPVKTMQNLGLAMGLELANDPALEDFGMAKVAMPVTGNGPHTGQTAVMQQYTPGDYDGHFVVFNDANAKRRATAFFATASKAVDGVPTLIP